VAKVQKPFAMTNILNAASLIAILINSLIIVCYGRRRVLLRAGFACCGILQLIIAVVYDKQP
jgi:hypothetical protein